MGSLWSWSTSHSGLLCGPARNDWSAFPEFPAREPKPLGTRALGSRLDYREKSQETSNEINNASTSSDSFAVSGLAVGFMDKAHKTYG